MILGTRAAVVKRVTYENRTDETGWSLEHSGRGFGRGFRCVYLIFLVLLANSRYAYSIRGQMGLATALPGLFFITYGLSVSVAGLFARRGERWGIAFIGPMFALPVPLLGAMAGVLLIRARDDWSNAQRWLAYGIIGILGLVVIGVWSLLAVL